MRALCLGQGVFSREGKIRWNMKCGVGDYRDGEG